MNRARKATGIAIAAAAASLFAVAAAPVVNAQGAKVECHGVNACKGQSECKTAKTECKGHNACKGQGYKEMSKAECDKAKMSMKK